MTRSEDAPLLQTSKNPERQPRKQLRFAIAAACGLALALFVVYRVRSSANKHPHQLEPVFCDPDAKHDIGYVKLPNKVDTHYFFWYFESRSAHPETDPLVLWLSGGGSSIFSALAENGPCRVLPDLTTEPNPYSWNTNANVIWLDQPAGQGFSYGPSEDTVHNSAEAAVNIYWFLQEFLGTKHPEVQDRDFFIAGESYAGHYIPSTAHFIRKTNQEASTTSIDNSTIVINLQGIAIGNGMVNPIIQYAHIPDMIDNAYNISLLTEDQAQEMSDGAPQCVTLTQNCQDSGELGVSCLEAQACWNATLYSPFLATKRNVYDIRQPCEVDVLCYNFSSMAAFLNSDPVYEYMGVSRESVPSWAQMSLTVTQLFIESGDWSMSFDSYVTELLDAGLRVLIYAGDADVMCNWAGNDAWTKALKWKGREGFNAAEERPFYPDARPAAAGTGGNATQDSGGGTLRRFENFAFLRVFNAGHMVPMDQPQLTLDMMSRFLKSEL